MNVFKKIKEPRTLKRRRIRQRGQVILLYALLVPMLFFFVGLTFDLSWYYINVARMQNAADAAVLAGAQTLIDDEQVLSDFTATTFVNGFDGSKTYESSRDTLLGDRIAKTYVEKNLSKDSDWNENAIIDLWTKNELYFNSTLWDDDSSDYSTLYYHVMLEEEVPHMFLRGWFSHMNAKVSSVVKITQYMKGYDFFMQMKYLGEKQTYNDLNEICIKKGYSAKKDDNEAAKKATEARSVLSDIVFDAGTNPHYVETLNFTDDGNKNILDNLFAGFKFNFAGGTQPYSSDDKSKLYGNYTIHRIINIDTVYPVRDYDFYDNYKVLEQLRAENPAYYELSDSKLASALAKDSPDPMYIRIESESDSEAVRQVIINVNVSNMNKLTERPIVLFYEGPKDAQRESLPVILNLNADFRGILYAPNSPVVINGNAHEFQGFVIADSFVQLMTASDEDSKDYTQIADLKTADDFEEIAGKYYDSDGTEYTKDGDRFVDAEGNVQYKNVIFVDDYGEVQYKKNFSGEYETVAADGYHSYKLSDFNLASAEFDTFGQVLLEAYTPTKRMDMTNNLFTTEYVKTIK